jgi:hypothetical protein
MSNLPLATFIDVNRDELIGRCRAKVAKRSEPPPTHAEIDHGVPLLLTQLATELKRGVPRTDEISDSARSNGHALLVRGLSVDQVVRNYGDVCQAVTEMAVETETPISAEDFRTLNQCLDDAIAGALTEFAKGEAKTRDGELSELWSLVNSASVAFEALQSGRVGVRGATAGVARQCLAALRAYVDRREMDATRATAAQAVSSESKPHP